MPEGKGADLLRALGVASVVAIPISLAALAFLTLVDVVTQAVWDDIPAAAGFEAESWWWVLLIPTIGGVLAGLAVRTLPGTGGHDPIDGFSAKPVQPAAIAGVVLAALATLSFGAVLGPEAVALRRLVPVAPRMGAPVGTPGRLLPLEGVGGGSVHLVSSCRLRIDRFGTFRVVRCLLEVSRCELRARCSLAKGATSSA